MDVAIFLAVLRTLLFLGWRLLRSILGWGFIALGLVGMPMPIVNGVVLLLIGVALVGHRNRQIRWSRVQLKLFIRRWAAMPQPLVAMAGRLALLMSQEVSRQHRRLRWRWVAWQRARRARRAG